MRRIGNPDVGESGEGHHQEVRAPQGFLDGGGLFESVEQEICPEKNQEVHHSQRQESQHKQEKMIPTSIFLSKKIMYNFYEDFQKH